MSHQNNLQITGLQSKANLILFPGGAQRPKIELNEGQKQALKELIEFAYGEQKLHLLTGFAGTGKTTIVQGFVAGLRHLKDYRKIIFTAPTNKAAKVLQGMVQHWGLNIECTTCHRLLGLRPTIDEKTGKQKFVPDRKRENSFDLYDLIVVDEASMIGSELWECLIAGTESLFSHTKVLFVGDEAQLPPIGERESRAFMEILDVSRLTEVVRYGNSIGVLAESLRNRLNHVEFPPIESDHDEACTQGVFALHLPEWEAQILRAFTSVNYQRDPDFARVLAYTNARVKKLNELIRSAIYGPDAPRFVKGDRLVAKHPVMRGSSVLLETSGECEVASTYQGESNGWKVWGLTIVSDEGDHFVQVLHEADEARFDEKLKQLADRKAWREYWELYEQFAWLEPAYAMTVHKSQGSGFRNVFLDLQNLQTNRNVRERNQLAYTGATRAIDRLFICV